MKIFVATPAYAGQLTTSYFESFYRTIVWAMESGHQIGIYQPSNESLITRARNACASRALQSPEKWDKLLFIDADIGFRPEDVELLINSDKKIVGLSCPFKSYPIQLNFNVYPEQQQFFAGQSRSKEQMQAMSIAYGDKEVPVRHLGTAFLMIDCEVFKKLSIHTKSYLVTDPNTGKTETMWDFFKTGVDNDIYLSEDWYFCKFAKEHGFTTYLNTSSVVTHSGPHKFEA